MPSSAAGCFHCGLPVPGGDPWRGTVAGEEASFCCAGCRAVAEAIDRAGLVDYYQQRTAFPERPEEAVPAELGGAELLDREEVQRSFVRDDGAAREASLILEGITCAACIWLNERQLQQTPGILDAQVNYTTHRARVRWDPERITLSQILQRIGAIGYTAHPYDPERQEAAIARERRDLLKRIGVAAMGAVQLMMIAVGIYAADFYPIDERFLEFFRWISFALAVPVVAYSARPFFTGAWSSLRRGQGSMDIPVALALGLTFAASSWATVSGRGDVYFETMAMFVLFLLTSRYLEMNARKRAAEANEELSKLVPNMARRLEADGGTAWVPVGDLQSGDRVRVVPGETIPVDGTVAEGHSDVNESALTGEQTPVHRGPGETVLGGTTNGEGPLTIQVERVGEETFMSGVLRLLEDAQAARPRIARQAERASRWFVWALLATATVVGAAWWVYDPERAFWIVVALLIVTCPCALALATPTALVVATGELAKRGVLAARGEALETLSEVTRVVFDKTGTLTRGRLRLSAWKGHPGALKRAAALEQASEHPVAAALVGAADDPGEPGERLENFPGRGVSGHLEGRRYWVGAYGWVAEQAGAAPEVLAAEATRMDGRGETVVGLASETGWEAVFGIADEPRPEARATVAALRERGWAVSMVTGDSEAAAGSLARQAGIGEVHARQRPEDKLDLVRAWQRQGEVVAVVGDGLNDGPVLAGADVSFAMGAGVQAARASADFILLSNRLERLPEVAHIGEAALRNIRQNLKLSFGYNALVVPLAALGWVAPWMAAILMPASSLMVVGNALRLRGLGRQRARAAARAPAPVPHA
ncbi:heavy metal translocating P-type ATPase [Thiohalorhabdus denitrificans]|uniref:Cu2+-exporting ATPase n=1 Tax=Thiohalorhabdus denitrificans TaxID=381306 RepID=A0A1G5EIT6_9GAMM|nr:heavy metal translocating P-type ATPase [Thiohalorhabdus denitrificans]SCY26358.1 Cu2+-exporting ATPase [Thiohalorhabdus denitrificans]